MSWLKFLSTEDISLQDGHLSVEEETPEEQQLHKSRRHIVVTVFSLLLLGLAVWSMAGIYMSKAKVGSSYAALHASNASLEQLITSQANSYKLSVIYPDGSKKQFSLQEVGVIVDSKATVENLRDQQSQFSNRVQWWKPIPAYLSLKPDGSRLDEFVSKNATLTIQPPQDATLSIKDGKAVLTNSVAGSQYGLSEPFAKLNTTISSLQSGPIKLETLSSRPSISSKQLESSQAKLQKILSQRVVLVIDNKKTQVPSADIAIWVEITPSKSGKDVDVTINSGKVLDYINKISAVSVHLPKSQVEVINADGTHSVLVSGVSGTDVVDKSTIATNIAQGLLQSDKPIQEIVSVRYTPFETITSQTYDKWIEVDTTTKRMYAYEKSNLARTFLISAGAPATPTVTGQYAIYSKFAQQDMRGQNVDGSSYFQPKVPWVNYFYADYAIHGNYWRPLSYFGSINSSHGCVGIVDSDAQWLYSWAPIGTPVIVHT